MSHNVGMVHCPNCHGQGGYPVHVRSSLPGESGFRRQTCDLCEGRGQVREHEANAYRERQLAGEAMRADRKRRMVTLREEAKRLGISPQELSRRENGREP
ncbi:MAG: helix-turn-helix domain-containing protein [Phycisphaerales bacterium]